MKVVVVGAAGYAGGELLRLVLGHPEVSECIATSRSQAGKPLAEVHPGIAGVSDARFAGLRPGEAADGADVVFLALEHGESSRVAGEVLDAGPGLVIDLAADFRIHDGRLHERFYGPHPAPDLVHHFRYGLADVLGTALHGARAIAAPGCFATAAQLALYPLREISLATPPALFAVTGSSGAGASPRATTHHPARAHNLFAYGVMGHRHEGEVLEQWRAWTGNPMGHARLLVHAGPFVRGIALTLHATLREADGDAAVNAVHRAWVDRPGVRVGETPPELAHVVGSNTALVSAATSEDRREIQIMVALDNLIKGAGGQALQGMNLALGLPEMAGLRFTTPFPI